MAVDINTRSSFCVQYAGQDKYRVSEDDAAVIDQTSVVNEAELNRLCSASGIQFRNGQAVSADGVGLSSKDVLAATSRGGGVEDQPKIPSSGAGGGSVPQHAQTQIQGTINWVLQQVTEDLTISGMVWSALSVAAEQNRLDSLSAKQMRNTLGTLKIQTMQENLHYMREQIQANRDAATQKLAFAAAACAASIVAAGVGGLMANSGMGTAVQAAGSGIAMSSGSFGSLLSASGEYYVQNDQSGGTYRSTEMQKKMAQTDITKEAIDQAIDQIKNYQEQAHMAFQNSLKTLSDYFDRLTQMNSKTFS